MHKLLFLVLISTSVFADKVRNVEVRDDQIVTVRTSVGIATIIQVPDRPNSVVVGDQDAFKVEYLDHAITIKPLMNSARSNLYVYTDWKRYNVELVTGPQTIADYVVYLRNPKKKVSSNKIHWRKVNNFLRNGEMKLTVSRVGKLQDQIYLIEFVITSEKSLGFKPEWLWITQDGQHRTIKNLVFNDLKIGPKRPITGLAQIDKSELDSLGPIRLELRTGRTSFLTLPKVESWN